MEITDNLAETMMAEIDAITDLAEYEHYGLRVVTDSPYKRKAVRLKVGRVAPRSYVWDDNCTTSERLRGASAIEIYLPDWPTSCERAIERLRMYRHNGSQVVLLGSEFADCGEDDGEIVMRDAVVLASWVA